MIAAAETIKAWRDNPRKFVNDLFNVTPDTWQSEALDAVADPNTKRISLQAAVGPGKSCVLAWVGWWFLVTQGDKGDHPNGVAMSVTSDNLKDNLWKEFSKWHGQSDILQRLFVCTKERIFSKDHSATWWISARSWPKAADPETQGRSLSGLHSGYVMYLIDESGDIAPAILRAAEQGLSSCKWGKIIQAGNPINPDGMLALASGQQSAMWKVIRITGDPDDPNRSQRIDLTWAKEQIEQYGRDNPWVMGTILGKFPPSSLDALIAPDEVRDAMNRSISQEGFTWAQKRLGVDVARSGGDRTVFFKRQGLLAERPTVERYDPKDIVSQLIADRVLDIHMRWVQEKTIVDATGGWAAGAVDILRGAGHSPTCVQFHGKPRDKRYKNRRAEMWLEMVAWIKRGGILPNMPELIAELTTPTKTFHNGVFLLEEKDQVKKRLGRSPDIADALAVTFAIPERPATDSKYSNVHPGGQVLSDYDPLA